MWTFIGAATETKPFAIDGINVWDCHWERQADQSADVSDPHYHQQFTFPVYVIRSGTVTFAAGEFSNGIWGFYQMSPVIG
ncbi:MAG: hypothetical protein ACJ8C4_12980 [Gemmataceae bacterium]